MSARPEPRLTAVCCPTCGHKSQAQAVPLGRLEDFISASLQRRVVQYLISKPRGATISQIVKAVYADDIDGGPLYSSGTISVTLVRLRAALAPLGWTITKGYGKGGNRPIQLVSIAFGNQTG